MTTSIAPQHLERSAVAVRHVAFEDLGLFGPLLAEAGFRITCREAPIADLRDAAIAHPNC